ncbi:hypothetical protein [Lysinibacillus endophyticus]|uniref:hypothetical protein n=1 Tax=Ureibacillus endophyticus TaxID=1978490 RepID=UPI0031356F2C
METIQLYPKTIHELLIDTANGDRIFELIYGNLLAIKTDLWVTTVYAENKGELFNSIKNLLGLGSNYYERKIVPLTNGGYIGFIDDENQKLLTVNIDKKEGSIINPSEFQEIIQATFSAVAALTYEGYTFQEISLPVIGKKGLQPQEYEGSLKWFIHYAINYLKFSHSTKKIKYFIHIKEDVPYWNEAITQLFTKNVMDPPNSKQFSATIKDEIVTLIDTFPKISRLFVKEILDVLRQELSKHDSLNYTLLLNKADELVDCILKDLYKLDGIVCSMPMPTYRLSREHLMELQEAELIPDGFFNYFITIRNLKNIRYFQTDIDIERHADETVLFLLLLQRIISFYQEFYRKFY